MIDFASVTAVQVKEGSVKQIHMGSQKVWDVDRWEIDWKWDGSLPSSSEWTYPAGSGTVANASSQGAIRIYSDSVSKTAGIHPKAGTFVPSDRCIFEAEMKIVSAQHNQRGVHIGLTREAGSSALLAYIYEDPEAAVPVVVAGTQYKFTTFNEWHTFRLELDTVNKSNKVYVDDTLAATVANSALVTSEISAPYLIAIGADCYVRAIRYKRIR